MRTTTLGTLGPAAANVFRNGDPHIWDRGREPDMVNRIDRAEA